MPLIEIDRVACGPPSSFTLPLTGRPWADLTTVLASTENRWSPGQQVVVQIEDGPEYRMTVERSGPRGGFTRLRLIGGKGGLGKDIREKYYQDIPAKTVFEEILSECGEAIGTVNLPGKLRYWVRRAGPAHEAVRALMMKFPQHVWRMAPDGKVHVEVPRWPPYPRKIVIDHEDASTGAFTCEFTRDLLPGQHVTLKRGLEEIPKRATRVTQVLGSRYAYPKDAVEIRTIIGTGDGSDVGVDGLHDNVRRIMRHTDYHALRPATIIRDHGDHTVDVEVIEAGWPRLTRIPLLVRLPGVRVRVKAHSEALLIFQQGDPSQPIVECRQGAVLQRLELHTAQGASLVMDDDRGQKSPEEAPGGHPRLSLTDQAGQTVVLDSSPGREQVTLTGKTGSGFVIDGVTGDVTWNVTGNFRVTVAQAAEVAAGTTMKLHAPLVTIDDFVKLAGGLQPVARVTDQVAGTTIITGSPKVSSG